MNADANEHTLAELRTLLGPDHVRDAQPDTERYEQCTLAHPSRVGAVVRPSSPDQVQEIVRIAARHRTPIYTISRGRNWGYGSRAPTANAIVVDLSRMNRILEYDPELAYVRVEPGVTQQQLVDFLAEQGGRLWADTTSVSPESSVVGNILERGHGLTPYADHVDCVGDMDVVLGDGRLLSTGHGRFGATAVAPLDRFGAGPSLLGLFSQSSFGIVTAASVWLMPAPESARAFVFRRADGRRVLPPVAGSPQVAAAGHASLGSALGQRLSRSDVRRLPLGSCRAGRGGVQGARPRARGARKGRGAWRGCCARLWVGSRGRGGVPNRTRRARASSRVAPHRVRPPRARGPRRPRGQPRGAVDPAHRRGSRPGAWLRCERTGASGCARAGCPIPTATGAGSCGLPRSRRSVPTTSPRVSRWVEEIPAATWLRAGRVGVLPSRPRAALSHLDHLRPRSAGVRRRREGSS